MDVRQSESDSLHWTLTSLVDDSMHYIRNNEGGELLFDLRVDPNERRTLAQTPAGRPLADVMRTRLDSVLRDAERIPP